MKTLKKVLQTQFEALQQFHFSSREQILTENDFLKIINLEQRYNYFKSLIKLQRLNNLNEYNNQTKIMSVMELLMSYYAECVNEIFSNMSNISFYFKQKVMDLNMHYVRIVQKRQKQLQNSQNGTTEKKGNKQQLGNISQINVIKSELSFLKTETDQEDNIGKSMKVKLNKNIMAAIQTQQISKHINQSNKKLDFLKKSVASCLKSQQLVLQNRIKAKKQKNSDKISDFLSKQSRNTLTSPTQWMIPKLRPKQYSASFGGILNKNHQFSSDDSLDEVDLIYINNFKLQDDK